MSQLLTPPTYDQETLPSGGEPGAWLKRWNWGLTCALAIMIAPTMCGRESILAPPEPLKGPFAKGVEAVALGFLLLWMIRHRWMPRLTRRVGSRFR